MDEDETVTVPLRDVTRHRVDDETVRNGIDSIEAVGAPEGVLLKYYADDRDRFLRVRFGDDRPTDYPILALGDGVAGPLDGVSVTTVDDHLVDHDDETVRDRIARAAFTGDSETVRQFQSTDDPREFAVRAGDVFWNGTVSRVTDVDADGGLDLRLGTMDYYTALSGEAMVEELQRELVSHSYEPGSLDPADADLPARDDAAPSVAALRDVDDTPASLGVVLPTIVDDGDTHRLLVARRSDDVPFERHRYDAVPGGTVQPTDGSNPVYETGIAEICEELLGDDDHAHRDRIETAVDEGRAHLDVTGLGLSALDGNFEVTGLFYVEDPDLGEWLLDRLDRSWEHESVETLDLPLAELPEQFGYGRVSMGAALGFARGLERARDAYGVDVGPLEAGPVAEMPVEDPFHEAFWYDDEELYREAFGVDGEQSGVEGTENQEETERSGGSRGR